jgi:hypothetical protein
MFVIGDDMTIHITRGDMAVIKLTARLATSLYGFRVDDVVRLKVFAKKNCEDVVLKKDVTVTQNISSIEIELERKDTTIGEYINKPVDYWYEVELNPDTKPQTIIGYDESGPKIFRLYPEGGVANE